MSESYIYIPICLILCMPIILILMNFLPVNLSVGMKFKLTSFFILVIWSLLSNYIINTYHSYTIWEWLAGVLLILAFELCAFMIWSVICWGYTLSMLLAIAKNNSVENLIQWQSLYTHSDSFRVLTENRLGVLVKLRCVSIAGSKIIMTWIGYFIANCILKISYLVGIKK